MVFTEIGVIHATPIVVDGCAHHPEHTERASIFFFATFCLPFGYLRIPTVSSGTNLPRRTAAESAGTLPRWSWRLRRLLTRRASCTMAIRERRDTTAAGLLTASVAYHVQG